MDNTKLKTFITVTDTGSINKAAEILKLAPVSIKRQMDAIESEMNTTLLIRTSSGTSLTEAGKLYYDFANKTLKEFDKVSKEIENLKKVSSSTLIICTGKEYATLPLDLFSTEYIIQNPGKKVLYLPSESDDWFDLVKTKKADCAFVTYEQFIKHNDGSVKYTPMYPRRYMVILSPNDPLSSNKIITFEDLVHRSVVMNADSFNSLHKKFKECHIDVIDSRESPSTSTVFNYIIENRLYLTVEPIDKQYAPLISIPLDFSPIECGWLTLHSLSSSLKDYIELSKKVAIKNNLI